MAFTVEDFHDLLALLARRPEWRAELRRHILDDELLELPALVRQLAEAQGRTEQQVAALVDAQARTESRLDRVEVALAQLAEAQARAEARLAGVEERLAGVEERLEKVEVELRRQGVTLARVADRVGTLEGDMLEMRYERRGPAYLSRIAKRLRVMDSGRLADLLDDAVDEGQLTVEDREEIMLADVVLTGRMRETSEDVYLLVEVSNRVDPHDVDRAAERSLLLAKLGRPVVPVAAGKSLDEDVAALARARGVWSAIAGLVTAPRSA